MYKISKCRLLTIILSVVIVSISTFCLKCNLHYILWIKWYSFSLLCCVCCYILLLYKTNHIRVNNISLKTMFDKWVAYSTIMTIVYRSVKSYSLGLKVLTLFVLYHFYLIFLTKNYFLTTQSIRAPFPFI